MLSKTIQDAINEQIGKEFYSAYIYLQMSSYFQSTNLSGCAHWMRLQYGEEVRHALKLSPCHIRPRRPEAGLRRLAQCLSPCHIRPRRPEAKRSKSATCLRRP